MEKTCLKCNTTLPLNSFKTYNRTLKDGTKALSYYAQCSKCINKAQYERRKNNPETYERMKERSRKRSKKASIEKPYLSANRQRTFINKNILEGTFKDVWLKRKYGITLTIYNKMRADQNYCCSICNRSEGDLGYLLNVDHSHKTGNIRALLCIMCNTALGKIEKVGIEHFIAYLNKF